MWLSQCIKDKAQPFLDFILDTVQQADKISYIYEKMYASVFLFPPDFTSFPESLTSSVLSPRSMRTRPVQAAQVVWSWVTWWTSGFAFLLGSMSSKPA